MVEQRGYQLGYSRLHPGVTDLSTRQRKANTAIAVISDYLDRPPHNLTILDVGGSSGIMAEAFARLRCNITAIDIDADAIAMAQRRPPIDGVRFQVGDAMNLEFADDSVDVVLCCQVYEHVPNATRLLAEIRRVLKPGGICYFSAGNRLAWNEPHYQLPLLSVLPRRLAHYYLRLRGRGRYYHEKHLSYWGLKRLVGGFQRHDYTAKIAAQPASFCAEYMLRPGSPKQIAAVTVMRYLPALCPGYIWVLEKPG